MPAVSHASPQRPLGVNEAGGGKLAAVTYCQWLRALGDAAFYEQQRDLVSSDVVKTEGRQVPFVCQEGDM